VRAYELQAAFPWPADGMASAIAFNYTYQGGKGEREIGRKMEGEIKP